MARGWFAAKAGREFLCGLGLSLLLLVGSPGRAGEGAAPLKSILGPDGSLDLSTGFSGNLDVRGWRMVNDANGVPRFIRSTARDIATTIPLSTPGPESDPSDVYWDDQFPLAGTDSGTVYAVAADGKGNIYIGGSFVFIGSVIANRIAKWDGVSWSALGSGMDGTVLALALVGDDVYAAGEFYVAGGVSAPFVAKWSGKAWSTLGGGLSNPVRALAAVGNDLYAGGDFTQTLDGSVSASHVAKWNGSSWSALGGGVGGIVNALAASGNDVYAGGDFTSAGGVSANYIAKWDGSSWSPLGAGMGTIYPHSFPRVLSLAMSGNDLYAGGWFTTAGGVSANYVARWDGLSWSPLGSGTEQYRGVHSIAVTSGTVYVGGDFGTAGGVYVSRIAKWDGSSWSALGSGVAEPATEPNVIVYAIAVNGNDVYAGGDFGRAGGVDTRCIAKWDGASWSSLGSGGLAGVLYPKAWAVAATGNDVYVGGDFRSAGGVSANSVARWNGTSWSSLGTGVVNTYSGVFALAVIGSDVYAGGDFVSAGGVTVNHIGRWDGTSSWHSLGAGSSEPVSALAVIGNDLYATGQFVTEGGGSARGVGKWNGSSWGAMGNGLSGGTIEALAPHGSDLYAGGSFTAAGLVSANGVAKWDGSSWAALGSGLTGGSVSELAARGNDLYAGGWFSMAGDVEAGLMAKWDGSSWHAMGSQMDLPPFALVPCGNNLFAAVYGHPDGVRLFGPSKWDGSSWSGLGTGMGGLFESLATVPLTYSVAISGNCLFAGGNFITAGSRVSAYFAVWQPRVNISRGLIAPAPGECTLGNDVYGFYKPALMTHAGTTISYPGGMPTTVTLDRAPEIHVAGTRVNGAFTLTPEGIEFGGTSATIRIEFSEDDAAAYGVPYVGFRPVRLSYPANYPTSMEAALIEQLGNQVPQPTRIENGRQIYGLDVPIAGTAGAYGAIPLSLLQGSTVWSCGDDTFAADVTNPVPGGTTGWTPIGADTADQSGDYDAANSALRVTIASSSSGPRIRGWMTANSEWLPYNSVTSSCYVRSKSFLFRSAGSTGMNEVPNMRLRLSTRFAVSSMLEVFNHLSGDAVGTNAGQELMPSTDPTSPSIYRVDFDPVDVPALLVTGEGIARGFEAYCLEPQEAGVIELAESTIGVYAASLLPNSGAPVLAEKLLSVTSSDAGDLAVMNSATDGPFLRKFVRVAPGILGSEVALDGSTDPLYTEGPSGVTLDSTLVAGDRVGIATREFTEVGIDTERLRVEPLRQYKVRFHVTSTTNANRNPQLRLRARALKFMWSQKLEIGGALAAGTQNNAIAQQALPGPSTGNPDQQAPGEAGGWYTLLMNTPMSADIQPSQPFIAAQPGPGQTGSSIRDIKFGFDLVDTLSGMVSSTEESGPFTLDRIELRTYNLLSD